MFTVFVGNNDQELANTAISYDQSAYLIEQSNLKDNYTGTAYVSLADLSGVDQLHKILRMADTIIYVPSENWTDTGKNHSQKYWVERSLNIFSLDRNKSVVNFPLAKPKFNSDSMLMLANQRKTNSKQLWVAGCSTTYGTGVDDDQTYASILSKKLKIELSLLAVPGSSIMWAADQLLRSDIKAGDIVVWGLTSDNRIPYFCPIKNSVLHITTRYYEVNPEFKNIVDINHLDDETVKYRVLTSIHQVINFCNKIGVNLLLVGIHLDFEFALNLKELPCYLHLNNFFGVNVNDSFIDYGYDTPHPHPGPLTHQWYAEKILEALK